MAYIDIDIDDYIEDISDYCLIRELRFRLKNNHAKQDLKEAFEELQKEDGLDKGLNKWPEINSVLDQQKQDWVFENWEKIQP